MNNSNEDIICYYDKTSANYVIIDRKTGFSSYKSIEEFEKQNQILRQKQSFCKTLTKNDIKEDLNVKKRFRETCDDTSGSDEDIEDKTRTQSNSQTIEWCLRPDMKIDESIKIDKDLIVSDGCLRVIGQLDNKYILCVATDRNLLLAFDQHAVHERIRYETILNEVFDSKQNVKSIPVLPPIDITLRFDDLETNFDSYRRQLRRLTGFEMKRRSEKSGLKTGHQNINYSLTQIPECLSDSLSVQSMVDMIEEALIIAKQTSNEWSNAGNGLSERTGSRLTPKLLERLQTKACRGAIRFGDALKLHDCLKLINSLSKCKVCFRCAHGRTSVAPLAYIPKSFHCK